MFIFKGAGEDLMNRLWTRRILAVAPSLALLSLAAFSGQTRAGDLTTIASFDGNNGITPYGGVTLDANGNLFGTTTSLVIPFGDGTVWEIARGTEHNPRPSPRSTAPMGPQPYAGVTLDANGKLVRHHHLTAGPMTMTGRSGRSKRAKRYDPRPSPTMGTWQQVFLPSVVWHSTAKATCSVRPSPGGVNGAGDGWRRSPRGLSRPSASSRFKPARTGWDSAMVE